MKYALAATLAVAFTWSASAAEAACKVKKLSGDYVYSSTLRAEGGEFFCHGAGIVTFAPDGRTVRVTDLDKCTGNGARSIQTFSFAYTFDATLCSATFSGIDPESGLEISTTIFFDSRGLKFRGVTAHNVEGISGSIEGERQ